MKKTWAGKYNVDYLFLGATIAFIFLGLVFLASASSVVSWREFGDSYYKIKQQIIHGILPGVFLFFLFFFLPLRTIKRIIPYLAGLVLLLLVLVFFPGVGLSHGQAHSWLGLGFFSFQPSELAKLVLILYLSLWFSNKKEKEIQNFYQGFLPFVFILGAVVGLVVVEPDLGTAIILSLIGLGIYFAAGAKKSHFFLLLLGGAFLGGALLHFAPSYQKNRLVSFLNPSFDPQGIGYQINQALLAIGSGGIWGKGLGNSLQKYLYLPEVEGDSIFAVVSEEIGFVFSILFLTFLLFILGRIFYLAKRSKETFIKLTLIGFFLWISAQSFINIGAIVGLLPLTGVTLPFVSYGGSSLAVLLGGIGIITNLTRFIKR